MPVKKLDERERAVALFEQGVGYRAAALELHVSTSTAKRWQQIFKDKGADALLRADHTYCTFAVKLQAIKAWQDGMTMREIMRKYDIGSKEALRTWIRTYNDVFSERSGDVKNDCKTV